SLDGALAPVCFSPDGKTLASGRRGHTIILWDVHSGQERATLQGHALAVTSVVFSPDGRTVASGSHDQTIKLWDAQSGQERASLKGHPLPVYSVAFSPDGLTLATGSAGANPVLDRETGEIKLWDVTTGQERTSLKGHANGVLCVCFNP